MASPRPGYTKSGKSLKSVRRYYALKNAGKIPQTTPPKDGSLENPPNLKILTGKKSRSPGESSKKIIQDYQIRKDLNEKPSIAISGAPTERSEIPHLSTEYRTSTILNMPKDITEKQTTLQSPAHFTRSPKSTKSYKSVATLGIFQKDISGTLIGFIIACILISLVYIVTWMSMIFTSSNEQKGSFKNFSTSEVGWIAATSLITIVGLLAWLNYRKTLIQIAVSLICLGVSSISLLVYLVINVFMAHFKEQDPKKVYEPNFLNYCLSVAYFIYLMVVVGQIIKQSISILGNEVREKSVKTISLPLPNTPSNVI